MSPLPISAFVLASAVAEPSSDSNFELILISCGVVLATALVGFIPVQIATIRRSRLRQAVIAVMVLWSVATAGSICWSVMRQMDYSTAYTQRIESGYFDTRDTSDKPVMPIGLWCGLGVAYALTIILAAKPGLYRGEQPANDSASE